jgi:type II secretory pathway component PulM
MMLSKRERKIAVFTVIILGAAGLYQIVLSPLLDRWDNASRRLELAQTELERANMIFSADLSARRKWKEMAADSVPATYAAAESQLLNHVGDWAREAGFTPTSLKPERNEREQGYQKITVRAAAVATMHNVARFLFAVQNADIPVRVSDIEITARREGTDELTMQVGLSTIYQPLEAEATR